jgi:hypothetical protein
MHINQDNYEQFFLDHAEGNLSPEMKRELADFLEANPDLKYVLDDFEISPIPGAEIRNESLRAQLKRNISPTDHISEDNLDEWLIRDLEGKLSESESGELKQFIGQNPAFGYDQKLYRHTRFVPDLSITFSRKNELKKKGELLPVRRMVWTVSAAAAVILLIIGIRFFHKPEVNSRQVFTSETPSHETPSHETPSQTHETPSQIRETPSQFSRPDPLRIKPSPARAIILQNPEETREIYMVAHHMPPVVFPEKKEKSLIAKIFINTIARARNDIRGLANRDRDRKTDFDFWSIAKAGVEGFNSISDRELELYVRKDANGKVKSYALVEQERLLLAKELNKN